MKIGLSILLIAIGAILAWALEPGLIPNVDQPLVGYILIGVGVVGLILSLILGSSSRTHRVTETHTVIDPITGESVTRNDIRGGSL